MKKLIALLVFSGLALAGCGSNQSDTKTSSSSASETKQTTTSSVDASEQKKLDQLRKDIQDAMTNENAVFPQLSKEVAEDAKEAVEEEGFAGKLFSKVKEVAEDVKEAAEDAIEDVKKMVK